MRAEQPDTDSIVTAYLGWGNPERDTVGMRLYATDHEPATAGRWDRNYQGGRVVEYAVVERFGQVEGDPFLVVRLGNRFMPDEEIKRLAAVVARAISDATTGDTDAPLRPEGPVR